MKRSNSFGRNRKKKGGSSSEVKNDEDYEGEVDVKTQIKANLDDKIQDDLHVEASKLFEQGEYDSAGEKWWYLAEKANQAGDKTLECTSLQNVATALVMMGEFQDAVNIYNKALKIAEDTGSEQQQVEVFDSLAWVYREVGHLNSALECMNALINVHKAQDNQDALGANYMTVANIYGSAAEYDHMLTYSELALECAQKVGSSKPLARIHGDIGTAKMHLEKLEDAIASYTTAIGIAVEQGDRDAEGRMYANLAIAYNQLEQYPKAVDSFQKARDIAKEIGDQYFAGRATADLAYIYCNAGEYDNAVSTLKEAVEISVELKDEVAKGDMQTQLGLTLLLYKSDPVGAEDNLQQAVKVWRAVNQQLHQELQAVQLRRGHWLADNSEALSFLQEHADSYALLQQALVQQQKEQEALVVAEESKGAALEQLMTMSKSLDEGSHDFVAEQPVMSVEEMQAVAAKVDCTLLMYTMVDHALLYCWVVTAASANFHKLEMGALLGEGVTLNSVVTLLHKQVATKAATLKCRGSQEQAAEDCEGDMSDSLKLLHKALLAPLAASLAAIAEGSTVVVVPHGVLQMVPFQALMDETGAPLVEKYAVSCTPSVRTLQLLWERQAAAVEQKKAFIVSHPDTLDQLELPPMEHAEAEVAELQQTLQGGGVDVSTVTKGEARIRPMLQSLLDGNYSWVHLTTHAKPKCIALAPTMPQPKLKLAEGEAPPAEEEGAEGEAEYDDGLMGIENLLTVYMPSAPTVVMTGSHTFAGELMEDGVFGLPRAWLASGAKSVVSHLWASPDEATKLLMLSFYRNCMGGQLSQAAALRKAILELRQLEDGKWQHPVFWSGVLLLGQCA